MRQMTVTVDASKVQPGERIVFKKFTWGERKAARVELAALEGLTYVERLENVLLERLVTWTLKDEHDQPIPANREGIEMLVDGEIQAVFELIQAHVRGEFRGDAEAIKN